MMEDEDGRRRSPAELNEPGVDIVNDRSGIEMDNYGTTPKRDFDLESVRSGYSNVHLIGTSNPASRYSYPTEGSVYSYAPGGTLGRPSVYSPTVDGMTVDGMTVGTESILDSGEDKSFTVERKDVDSHMHRWYKKPSRALSLIKMILALLLSAATLFCVVASKLTIIALAKALDNRKPNLTDVEGKHRTFICNHKVVNATHVYLYNSAQFCQREVVFLMLTIILMVPPAVTLVKLFVKTCRKITHPWPTKLAILWVSLHFFPYIYLLSIVCDKEFS